jgi:hypothetical protein
MEELTTGVVFRLATITHVFPPDSKKLHVLHLEFSQNDKKQATERGTPALLSVFDATLTTVSQAEDRSLYRELRVRLADLSFRYRDNLPF